MRNRLDGVAGTITAVVAPPQMMAATCRDLRTPLDETSPTRMLLAIGTTTTTVTQHVRRWSRKTKANAPSTSTVAHRRRVMAPRTDARSRKLQRRMKANEGP